jgi:hypothetical protein
MQASVKATKWRGRRAWALSNDRICLVVLEGGGHLASFTLHTAPTVNPFWVPAWRTIEPWQYRPSADRKWGGSPLLASISGHLLCLSYFGVPSAAEARLGRDGHGEAPLARWRLASREVTPQHARLRIACELPVAGMSVLRAFTMRPGSHQVEVVTEVQSTVDRDQPYTMSEHGSVGAPFLEKGITRFDLSAREGHTYPGVFGARQRLKPDAPFIWPDAPGATGEPIDLRAISKASRSNSDFSAQHMDPARADAWASAVNPRQGVLLAYHWCRQDFPWCGNWEENFCRQAAPWSGRSLARGIELANTPFPTTLQDAVALNRMHGERTYGWLPARGVARTAFRLVLLPVDRRVAGVADIRATADGLAVDLMKD